MVGPSTRAEGWGRKVPLIPLIWGQQPHLPIHGESGKPCWVLTPQPSHLQLDARGQWMRPFSHSAGRSEGLTQECLPPLEPHPLCDGRARRVLGPLQSRPKLARWAVGVQQSSYGNPISPVCPATWGEGSQKAAVSSCSRGIR